MKAHIKIIKDDDLSFRKGEDRYIVVSSTNKLLCNCFGYVFLQKNQHTMDLISPKRDI